MCLQRIEGHLSPNFFEEYSPQFDGDNFSTLQL